MTSQITGVSIVCSVVCSGTDQRKHQSWSLAFVRGIHRGWIDSPHKGSITRKMFPFDEAFMQNIFIVLWPQSGLTSEQAGVVFVYTDTENIYGQSLPMDIRNVATRAVVNKTDMCNEVNPYQERVHVMYLYGLCVSIRHTHHVHLLIGHLFIGRCLNDYKAAVSKKITPINCDPVSNTPLLNSFQCGKVLVSYQKEGALPSFCTGCYVTSQNKLYMKAVPLLD